MNGGRIMLRTIPAIAVVICAALIGLSLSSRIIRRTKVLEQFSALLRQAHTRLSYTSETLSSAFNDNAFSYRFSEHDSFKTQWRSLVSAHRQEINHEDADVLTAFANGIGEGDLNAQLSHIKLYQALIDDRVRASREEYDVKARLYRTLSVSAGLVIAMILI